MAQQIISLKRKLSKFLKIPSHCSPDVAADRPLLVIAMVLMFIAGCSGSSGGGEVSLGDSNSVDGNAGDGDTGDTGGVDVGDADTGDTDAGGADTGDTDTGDGNSGDENKEATVRRLMAVGDSITHGLLDPGPSASWRLPFTLRLDDAGCAFQMVGSQTSNALHNAFESPHEGYSSQEAGHFVTGHTNYAGENPGIFLSMQRHEADVVLLHVGTNDVIMGQSNQETLQEIDQIVSTILDADGDVLLANVIPTYTAEFLDGVDARNEALAPLIEAYVAQLANPRVQLVDVRQGYTRDLMFDDGIHPNDQGSQHIADAFYLAYITSGYCP